LLDGDARARQRRLELHVVLAVERRVGDAGGQRIELVARRGGQLDAGGKRLAEARFDGEPAEAQRVHVSGCRQRGGKQRESKHRISTHTVPSPNA
jgi:hypothetical protein